MSAMVEIWVGELEKLREKVLSQKPKSKSKSKSSSSEAEHKEAIDNQSKNTTSAVERDSTTMSEATVCLLMDRFAPW